MRDDPSEAETEVRPALVGVGVGPGDPDLLTLRALAVLRGADRVLAPTMAPDVAGRAESVVRAAAPDLVVERVVFAIVPDTDARRAAHTAAAERVAACLDAGERVGFVTLGDPNVYSTFHHLAHAVRLLRPGVAVGTVPGIMAFQDLAARSGTVVLDGGERLHLVSAVDGPDVLEVPLADPEAAVVVYKGGRHLPELAARLKEAGRLEGAVLGELLGLPGERVAPLAEAADGPGSYLASVLVPPRRAGGPGAAPPAAP
ncbi:MAG TPA: precorrin-2 C(20)-methyltransferase [Acidimicrobiales bacterium]|nr:precorrin-2 C(20)-methyltransferase [Acidimicrobiales bacterium]